MTQEEIDSNKKIRDDRERWIKDMQDGIRKKREEIVIEIKNTENLDDAIKILGKYTSDFASAYKIGAYTIE